MVELQSIVNSISSDDKSSHGYNATSVKRALIYIKTLKKTRNMKRKTPPTKQKILLVVIQLVLLSIERFTKKFPGAKQLKELYARSILRCTMAKPNS